MATRAPARERGSSRVRPTSTGAPRTSSAGCSRATSPSSTTTTSTGSRPRTSCSPRSVAVVNAVASITGRYPNVGPLLLAAAGIPLVDEVGPDVMDAIVDGDLLRIDGDRGAAGRRGGRHGQAPDAAVARGAARSGQAGHWARSSSASPRTRSSTCGASGTCSSTRPTCPTSTIDLSGRHVLVVVRGLDYREDLGDPAQRTSGGAAGPRRCRRRRRRPARVPDASPT